MRKRLLVLFASAFLLCGMFFTAVTPVDTQAATGSVTRKLLFAFEDDSAAPDIGWDTGVELYYQVTGENDAFDISEATKVSPQNECYYFDATVSSSQIVYIYWKSDKAYGPVDGGMVNTLTFSLTYENLKNDNSQAAVFNGINCDSASIYSSFEFDQPFDTQTGVKSWSYKGTQINNIAKYEVVVAKLQDDWTGPTPCDLTSNNKLNFSSTTGTYSWQGQNYNYWHKTFSYGANSTKYTFNVYSVIGTYLGGGDGVYIVAIFPCKADGTILMNCGCTDQFTIPSSYKTVALASFTLASSKFAYTGSAITPAPIVKDKNGKTVSSSNYQVSYSSNKAIGVATVTVTGKGKYTGTLRKTFQIIPKKTALVNLKSLSKSLCVTWKKITAQTTGYEIQYSTNKNFKTSVTKRMIVTENSQTKDYIRNLKAKTTYYVRIRTYKLVEADDLTYIYYSAWSSTKACKTK